MKTETVENGTLENWTPAEVKEAFDRDEIVLIDVRTPQEYGFERIEGAHIQLRGPPRCAPAQGRNERRPSSCPKSIHPTGAEQGSRERRRRRRSSDADGSRQRLKLGATIFED